MGARADAVEAELAFRVGDDAGAVFHIKAHAGDAGFAVALHAVAVAVGEHGAGDEAPVAEHPAQHAHPRGGGVRAEAGGRRAGAIDAVALHRVDRQLRAVGQRDGAAGGDGADRPVEGRPGAAGRVGNRAGDGSWRQDQARSACHILEAGRQNVVDARTGRRCRCAVEHFHRVVDKIAHLGAGLAGRLGHQQVAVGGGGGEQRQVVVHHVRVARRQEEAQEVRLAHRQHRRYVDRAGQIRARRRQTGRVDTVGRDTAAQRSLRRDQGLRHGERQVAGGCRHTKFQQATAAGQVSTENRTRRRNDELIKTVGAGHLAHRRRAADQVSGRREPCLHHAVDVFYDQGNRRTGDGRAGFAVVHDAGRVERQVLLQDGVARREGDAQEGAGGIELRGHAAEVGNSAIVVGGAAHWTAIDDVAVRIAEADAVGTRNQTGNAVGTIGNRGTACDDGKGGKIKHLDRPARQGLVGGRTIPFSVVIDVLPHPAADVGRRPDLGGDGGGIVAAVERRFAAARHGRGVDAVNRIDGGEGRSHWQRQHAGDNARHHGDPDRRGVARHGARARRHRRSRSTGHIDPAAGGVAVGVRAGLGTSPAGRVDGRHFKSAGQVVRNCDGAGAVLGAGVGDLQRVFAGAADGEVAAGRGFCDGLGDAQINVSDTGGHVIGGLIGVDGAVVANAGRAIAIRQLRRVGGQGHATGQAADDLQLNGKGAGSMRWHRLNQRVDACRSCGRRVWVSHGKIHPLGRRSALVAVNRVGQRACARGPARAARHITETGRVEHYRTGGRDADPVGDADTGCGYRRIVGVGD